MLLHALIWTTKNSEPQEDRIGDSFSSGPLWWRKRMCYLLYLYNHYEYKYAYKYLAVTRFHSFSACHQPLFLCHAYAVVMLLPPWAALLQTDVTTASFWISPLFFPKLRWVDLLSWLGSYLVCITEFHLVEPRPFSFCWECMIKQLLQFIPHVYCRTADL